ncbi:hypothetical protein FA13DRAFT_1727030 [Coprinellus micaceus]|uniref:Uncharacterized protein n=1 Tax=Coprinellus micaceus TaxID=71717 RepID=A0A4Y7TSZ0_COPMI|nr:hypothetical protein FA13DRAFT_1727030 [Coprinellus micaceus]
MASNTDSAHRRKKNRLIGLFSGLNRSKSREPWTSLTLAQGDLVPPPAPDERSVPLHDGQLQESQRRHSHSPSSHGCPPASVEDCSLHHHGDNYYNSHNVHGTANYIGNVTSATLGTNSGEPAESSWNKSAWSFN